MTKHEITFSAKVKEELSRNLSCARHCQIAEIAAILTLCGRITIDSFEQYSIKVHTENVSVARKYFTLIRKTFNIESDSRVTRNRMRDSYAYTIVIRRHQDAIRVLQATKLLDHEGEIVEELSMLKNVVLQQSCCKRAFLRGAFLATGSMSNPEKSYHFEIVTASSGKAEQIKDVMSHFGIEAKVILRKRSYVVYLKEGAQIVDALNVMEAPIALMELENVRILKEMRNSVNRKVNCETANINKIVCAAVKQVEDIEYIRDTIGLHKLPENLEEIANLRLEYREASLKELGDLLSVPVGKSGVNHRLRKLSDIAEKLRENKEEQRYD